MGWWVGRRRPVWVRACVLVCVWFGGGMRCCMAMWVLTEGAG